MQARKRNVELGPRAARLKALRKVEEQMSSGDSEGMRAKRVLQTRSLKSSSRPPAGKNPRSRTPTLKPSKPKPKKRSETKPGPAVPSAVMRIDVWPCEKVMGIPMAYMQCSLWQYSWFIFAFSHECNGLHEGYMDVRVLGLLVLLCMCLKFPFPTGCLRSHNEQQC